jgi:ADP-ribosylglycohydrolase/catechol 2,3-dioxygenase-like lactoylglutathione lyase family enzyme
MVETRETILGRPQIAARARAAMLFAACGDALGWPIEPRGRRVGGTASLKPRLEFLDWRRREGGGYAPFERRVPPGTYSDDTQLMLCVARSLTHGDDWWDRLTKVELPLWPLYELGGGGAVRSAARSWAKGCPPWETEKDKDLRRYHEAGANGVAMRILPHAIYGVDSPSFSRVAERIMADGITTHGHPRALVGALTTGFAMWAALRWRGKVGYGDLVDACLDERAMWSSLPESDLITRWVDAGGRSRSTSIWREWEQATEEMAGLLSVCADAIQRGSLARDRDVLEELGAFGKENGSGTRSAAVAVYLSSRYVAKPAAGLLAAAFARHADTDTIACLTGAMLGAFTGDVEVDGLAQELQDAGYIEELAGRVLGHACEPTPPERWDHSSQRRVRRELDEGRAIVLPIFGDATPFDLERPPTKSANEISIWWLRTTVGQTLAITRIRKSEDGGLGGPHVSPGAYARTQQISIDEITDSNQSPVLSTWTLLFVDDLDKALHLYHEVLGIPIRERGDDFVVLGRHLVLEVSDHPEKEGDGFDAPGVVGVYVAADALPEVRERVARAGYRTSKIGQGRRGRRFRVGDGVGHIVEVFSSPGS